MSDDPKSDETRSPETRAGQELPRGTLAPGARQLNSSTAGEAETQTAKAGSARHRARGSDAGCTPAVSRETPEPRSGARASQSGGNSPAACVRSARPASGAAHDVATWMRTPSDPCTAPPPRPRLRECFARAGTRQSIKYRPLTAANQAGGSDCRGPTRLGDSVPTARRNHPIGRSSGKINAPFAPRGATAR